MTKAQMTPLSSRARSGRAVRKADERVSEISLVESDPRGSVELAAAILETRVRQLLEEACMARPDLLAKEVAERLGVSEGRVSQVLNGDESPKLSTFARYMRALGYRLEITAHPAEESVPALEIIRRGWWRGESSVYRTEVTDGANLAHVWVLAPDFLSEANSLSWRDEIEISADNFSAGVIKRSVRL